METLAGFPDARIAAVCDSDRALAESAAEPFGATAHINFRTLIESERLDAVLVCLPPFARGEPEIFAARAGIHLFVAGSVALSVEKARQVQKEIENAGIVACVASPWRYLSGTDRARELLEGKKIALVRGWRFGPVPPSGWRCRRDSSGGYFVQYATNLVDLARYLVGEVTTVSAMSSEGIAAESRADYDIEDAPTATLRFRNGAVGQIVAATVAPESETALSVVADDVEARITPTALEVRRPGRRSREDHAGAALRTTQEAFLEAVRTGDTGAVRSDYADAARTLEVALAAVESAETGKVVSL